MTPWTTSRDPTRDRRHASKGEGDEPSGDPTDRTRTATGPLAGGAAAAAGFIGLAGFELALALGAPLGRAAMGGTHTYLPAGLRIVAGFATLFWPLAALVVLRRGGYRVPLISLRVSRAGTWVLVGLLSLGVLMNLASSSDWERFLQAPFATVLAALCLVVARGPSGAAGAATDQDTASP